MTPEEGSNQAYNDHRNNYWPAPTTNWPRPAADSYNSTSDFIARQERDRQQQQEQDRQRQQEQDRQRHEQEQRQRQNNNGW
jgi:hypothetical protein